MLVSATLFAIILNVITIPQIFVIEPRDLKNESEDASSSEESQSQASDESANKKFPQMEWFKKHRVAVVREMLQRSNIGLSCDRGIDLLIAECSEKLKEVRNSEITKKRLKAPNFQLIGFRK